MWQRHAAYGGTWYLEWRPLCPGHEKVVDLFHVYLEHRNLNLVLEGRRRLPCHLCVGVAVTVERRR